MNRLGESFALEELRAGLQTEQFRLPDGMAQEDQNAAQGIWMLARSNYEVQFEPEQELSERIFSPPHRRSATASRMPASSVFRTTTAPTAITLPSPPTTADVVMPELVETSDFLLFRFITLNGPAAENKGMALFPRKINGLYAMLSRQDNENIYLMFSDNVHFWNERQVLLKPEFPVGTGADWELRIAHRDRRRLAGAQPRRGPHAQVLHRSVSAGSR